MRNENKENFRPTVALTVEALKDLKKRGFRYVRVNAFTKDKRLDYMMPHYIVVVPIQELPEEGGMKGIYEPVDSPVLVNWADSPDEGIEVFISI
ncbi:MAG TPA: hypothetical protein VGS79_25255 [Puia sp.]|nr:hypothetical protein [Puia sp.]